MMPLVSADPVRDATSSQQRAVVLEASRRTTHPLAEDAPRDPRYCSVDPDVDQLWRALGQVADPELPISVVDLGLICDVRRAGSAVEVDITFTATACPCMEFIIQDVRERLSQVDGVGSVNIREVWDPPWSTDRLTAHGRARLQSFGVAA